MEVQFKPTPFQTPPPAMGAVGENAGGGSGDGPYHLSNRELDELRDGLLHRRRKLLEEIRFLQNEAAGAAPAAVVAGPALDPAAWERTLALGRIGDKLSLLHEIDHALQRMEQRTYGICSRTRRPIALERLREIPWARSC